jgi:hypothetical protein
MLIRRNALAAAQKVPAGKPARLLRTLLSGVFLLVATGSYVVTAQAQYDPGLKAIERARDAQLLGARYNVHDQADSSENNGGRTWRIAPLMAGAVWLVRRMRRAQGAT